MNINSNNVSISMYVDKSNISKRKTLPLKVLIEKDNRIVYTWTPDSSVEVCYNCQDSFNFINRKHHCRNCGKIFCSRCSDYWIDIPKFVNSVDKENIYWKTNIKYVSILLFFWFVFSFLFGIVFKDFLNQFSIAGFKLGFWFAQQGSIYVFVILIFIYVKLMNDLDKKHGFNR